MFEEKSKKVLFKKWIPLIYEESESGMVVEKEGTGCWETEFKNHGVFLHWGVAFQEFKGGSGECTVAIVMDVTGEIVEVRPKNLKFDNEPFNIKRLFINFLWLVPVDITSNYFDKTINAAIEHGIPFDTVAVLGDSPEWFRCQLALSFTVSAFCTVMFYKNFVRPLLKLKFYY